MKKLFIVLAMLVIGASPAYASRGDKDKKETPSSHLKLDICHNNHIIPVSVHAADKIDTGHGLFDPVTHTFTARADVPGHDGDTVARAYLKAGNHEVDVYTNPDANCTGVKAPDSNNKVAIHVCVDSTLMLFEGTNVEKLKADIDAFIAAHVKDENIKIGTDCVPITTTTTLAPAPATDTPSPEAVTPTTSSPTPAPAVIELPRTGNGSRTLATVGAVLGLLGISLMLGTALWKRWNN